MTPQEINEANLLQLWKIGELIAAQPHIDRDFRAFISDLTTTVERVQGQIEPEYMPGLCGRCFNQREVARAIGFESGDYEMVECPECGL